MIEASQSSLVKMVQSLLMAEDDKLAITPELIRQKIELILSINPKWRQECSIEEAVGELIRRNSLWIGESVMLADATDHEPWLVAQRKQDWRYWQRYRELLEKDLSWKAVDALDRTTDKVLDLLEDPRRPGTWSRRGLVVGHVQSGKTANYTGLVCKAADAQYKVIIVLAGLHNNLRSQTQIRLEEGFLGYDTISSAKDTFSPVGVGLIDGDLAIKPNCATTRANTGDFGRGAFKHQAITPEERPWLFVVKKSRTVLVNLLKWIQNHVADSPLPADAATTAGDKFPRVLKRVTKLPLLIIDDEADNASVDTGEHVVDAEGRPNEEHDPTTINKLIRRILHSFSRSAYVGYTATPFANIFIHDKGSTSAEGPDLFPSAFIQNLAAPTDYVGPGTVFGHPSPSGREGGLPLIRDVSDFASEDGKSGWMPHGHKNGHIPRWSADEPLPPSLREALTSFVLACAVRELRGQGSKHSSMLVHVTRLTLVQQEVHRQVTEYLAQMRQRLTRKIGHEEILESFRVLWSNDFLPATRAVKAAGVGDLPAKDPEWRDVEAELFNVIKDIDVRMINGTAKDVLDYKENESKGLKVIAIGGDKLARGLTLEGLCSSYFLRASRMYDTLMQMGRWFGYRRGYLDLCRLYTSNELIQWFRLVSDASSELREEFDLMANSGGTPKDYGLKVQSHPDLMVTSPLKMRSAKALQISFSGQLMQTVTLLNDSDGLKKNLDVTRSFISKLGTPMDTNPRRKRDGHEDNWTGFLWKRVPSDEVVDFLEQYKTSQAAYKVDSRRLAEFIHSMNAEGELTEWTVALLGVQSGVPCELAPGIKVNGIKRTGENQADRYAIGVLLDPIDESIDLDEDQWKAAHALTVRLWEKKKEKKSEVRPTKPNGVAIREVRGKGEGTVPGHPERGLLVLYVLDPAKSGREEMQGMPDVVAFGISFPGSASTVTVEYKVNNVMWEQWEQQYGATE